MEQKSKTTMPTMMENFKFKMIFRRRRRGVAKKRERTIKETVMHAITLSVE